MGKTGVSSRANLSFVSGKIMLIGIDQNKTLERRLQAAGYQVIAVRETNAAIDHARHEPFAAAVVVSAGSLMNDAETIFNLRDLIPSMEIVVLIESRRKHSDRFFRQLIDHPIEHTRILTRRELQRQLPSALHPSPPGMPT